MMAVSRASLMKLIKRKRAGQTATAVFHWTWLTMHNLFPLLFLSYLYPQALYGPGDDATLMNLLCLTWSRTQEIVT